MLCKLCSRHKTNSAVRIKAIEQLLQIPELKLKRAIDTHWLSHTSACQTLMKVLPAVLVSLEREAQEHGDTFAHGLYKVVILLPLCTC